MLNHDACHCLDFECVAARGCGRYLDRTGPAGSEVVPTHRPVGDDGRHCPFFIAAMPALRPRWQPGLAPQRGHRTG